GGAGAHHVAVAVLEIGAFQMPGHGLVTSSTRRREGHLTPPAGRHASPQIDRSSSGIPLNKTATSAGSCRVLTGAKNRSTFRQGYLTNVSSKERGVMRAATID